INTLYNRAGINTQFRGEVNEDVAAVVGDLLTDIGTCSDAFRWVPRPTGGKASILWLVKNISQSVMAELKQKQSVTCMRAYTAVQNIFGYGSGRTGLLRRITSS